MARSNAVPFQIIAAAPMLDIGFEVRVIHAKDFDKLCRTWQLWLNDPDTGGLPLIPSTPDDNVAKPCAVITRFIEVFSTVEISGPGGGSITLDMDDELWDGTLSTGEPMTALKEYEHLWQVFENGALRGAFLGQKVDEAIMPDGGGSIRTVTIAGAGPADVLRDGVVMTPWYPNPTPLPGADGKPIESPYVFKRITHMGAWLYLLNDCQKRGTLTFVCTNFAKDIDSGGEEWQDKPVIPPDPSIAVSTLQATVVFAVDSATLFEAAKDLLNGLTTKFLTIRNPQITVVGHTDDTNTNAYNQDLSERRAQAVKDFLLSKRSDAVITAWGRGELEPVDTNKTVVGREHNRRVVITYPVGPLSTAETTFGASLGSNLYELLVEWTGSNLDQPSSLRAEWYMNPNFRLDVRKEFGVHREGQVVFFEGAVGSISKDRSRDRTNIRNLVAGQPDNGNYIILTDPSSVTQFRQREKYIALAGGATQPDEERLTIVRANYDLVRQEDVTWTIAVEGFEPGRRVFEDYTVGDWIGISEYRTDRGDIQEAFRVLAITIRVDANAKPSVELTLQSTQKNALAKLNARFVSFMQHLPGIKVYIQDEEPPNAKPGDLWTPRYGYT